MLLDKSTTKLEVVLLAAKTTVDCDFSAVAQDVYKDTNVPGILFTGVTNGVTPVTLVSAPADNVARAISELFVYNADSANVTVFVRYNVNGTLRIVKKFLLTPGQTLTYLQDYIWTVN